ncbi:BRO family protein [Bacillus wiedmannii]|nr:BRO family protein [Bacillus wiedmannii]MCU5150423.1 BRO family protein [Bacillus wiedmannii]MCU5410779.1 BRO family protein [Bacillus wiedmannii]
MFIINESGLYSLIMTSQKPQAKHLRNGLHRGGIANDS